MSTTIMSKHFPQGLDYNINSPIETIRTNISDVMFPRLPVKNATDNRYHRYNEVVYEKDSKTLTSTIGGGFKKVGYSKGAKTESVAVFKASTPIDQESYLTVKSEADALALGTTTVVDNIVSEIENSFYYGDVGTNPETFDGIFTRYNENIETAFSSNVLDGGGTSGNQTSIAIFPIDSEMDFSMLLPQVTPSIPDGMMDMVGSIDNSMNTSNLNESYDYQTPNFINIYKESPRTEVVNDEAFIRSNILAEAHTGMVIQNRKSVSVVRNIPLAGLNATTFDIVDNVERALGEISATKNNSQFICNCSTRFLSALRRHVDGKYDNSELANKYFNGALVQHMDYMGILFVANRGISETETAITF